MIRTLFKLIILILFPFSLVTSVFAELTTDENSQMMELFLMIQKRFELIEEAAAYKFLYHLPTYVPTREHEILAGLKQVSTLNQLDLQSVQSFINTQIRISLDLSNQWHRYWQKNGFNKALPLNDLDDDIRPKLAKLTDQMVIKIAQTLPIIHRAENFKDLSDLLDETVVIKPISKFQKEAILHSLIEVKKA